MILQDLTVQHLETKDGELSIDVYETHARLAIHQVLLMCLPPGTVESHPSTSHVDVPARYICCSMPSRGLLAFSYLQGDCGVA